MKLSHSIAALAACVPAAATAQEATPPANEVVVTGRGLETPAEATVAVVEIDRARILSEASHRLETLLTDVPALTLCSRPKRMRRTVWLALVV